MDFKLKKSLLAKEWRDDSLSLEAYAPHSLVHLSIFISLELSDGATLHLQKGTPLRADQVLLLSS
jgi:hypothetical protein